LEKKKLKPVIEGDWLIGPNPTDLDPEVQNRITPGEYRAGQEVVDHHIWKDAAGRWRLWACIRQTKVGRVFVGWISGDLEKPNWKCLGVVMRRDKNAGESLADHGDRADGEKLQSPFVIYENGKYYMFYGGGEADGGQYHKVCSICLATSKDGIEFSRYKNQFGDSVLFYGPGPARDPCLIKIGDLWHLYYSGGETGFLSPNKDYVRTSKDLINWSASREVCWGGRIGYHPSSAECPHVVYRGGYYYLFRTEDYPAGHTYVFRSEDPYDFGLDDDARLVGQIDVAAPEIVVDGEEEYISSNKDVYGGVRLHHLKWIEE
jgi:hypothetical protein